MPTDTVPELLDAGRIAYGAGATSFSPRLVEVYGHLGLDYVWIDIEHSGGSAYDADYLENLTRAADVSGTDLVVRITSGEPALVRKTLDAGVRNVVIPRVRSVAEVEAAVDAGRFVHAGERGARGVGSCRASVWGGRIGRDYPDAQDRAIRLGVMIEEADAIDDLEAILSVPDLGFTFLGPWDLARTMGADHPSDAVVEDAIATYEAASREAGVPFGRTVDGTPEAIDAAEEAGYRLISLGNEVSAVRRIFGDLLDTR